MLTEYNGQAITYDEVGNPLSYRDGITMTWQKGRELATLTKDNKTISYTYDANGIRSEKNNNGTVTKYFYDSNNNLISLKQGDTQLVFYYDSEGQPESVAHYTNYVATRYYYVKNLQGDVTKLLADHGTVIANYEYDAYGKLLSITNASGVEITSESSIALLNPLRYRGYVYDSDTGLYYLQSRYYDPEICRFINADDQLNPSVLGQNLFSYCENNPINYNDPCGHRPGGYYGSIDAAAIDFANNYNKQSIKNNWEYGTFIYAVKVKVYVYNNKYEYCTMYSYYTPWTDRSKNSVTIPPERNTKDYRLVALAHTHAAYHRFSDNENFSYMDVNLSKTYKLDFYLVTPKGQIKKYVYKTKKTITLSKTTYHDHRTQKRTLFKRHKCSKCAN